jgi:hypothetical protein
MSYFAFLYQYKLSFFRLMIITLNHILLIYIEVKIYVIIYDDKNF